MSYRSKSFSAQIRLAASVDAVFPLFSPLGETSWVPDWDPEILHPPGASWEEGLIFRTRERAEEAVWIVSTLDVVGHRVVYHRLEPTRYVARVEVTCEPAGERLTAATITYLYVGLSENGSGEIDEMTESDYRLKMERWVKWINQFLRTKRSP